MQLADIRAQIPKEVYAALEKEGIADLRQIIQETLKEKQAEPPLSVETNPSRQAEVKPQEKPQDNSKNENEKSRLIKPGESIKF